VTNPKAIAAVLIVVILVAATAIIVKALTHHAPPASPAAPTADATKDQVPKYPAPPTSAIPDQPAKATDVGTR
jgi:hypothetical protein